MFFCSLIPSPQLGLYTIRNCSEKLLSPILEDFDYKGSSLIHILPLALKICHVSLISPFLSFGLTLIMQLWSNLSINKQQLKKGEFSREKFQNFVSQQVQKVQLLTWPGNMNIYFLFTYWVWSLSGMGIFKDNIVHLLHFVLNKSEQMQIFTFKSIEFQQKMK